MFELLQRHDKDLNEQKGKRLKGKSQGQVSSRKLIIIIINIWNQEHQTALEDLIDCLTSPPVLAYPQFDQPYVLHTDASKDGLSVILYQRQEGKIACYCICIKNVESCLEELSLAFKQVRTVSTKVGSM